MPRNVSGTYTLPLPPVVPNTVIQAAWANTTTDDIAQGITDSLDRQGRGGMIAPFRLVDGSIASPALSFNAETGTGLSRQSAGVLAVSIMGSKVGQFAAGGFTGNLAGPLTISGVINFAASAALALDPGTVALPSLYWTGDNNTGLYAPSAGSIGFTAGSTQKMVIVNANVQVKASTIANSPSMVLAAGTNAGGHGYALDILGSGVATDPVRVRWLNNGYSIERFTIAVDSAGAVLTTPGALPITVQTNNTTRLVIDASGNARFTGPFVTAFNFWIGETTAAAGTVGVSGSLGASTVYWGNTSAGAGALDLYTGGGPALHLLRVASAVNYFEMVQAAAAGQLTLASVGADASVSMNFMTKGTGTIGFWGQYGAATPQFVIQPTAGATRYIVTSGQVGVAPTLSDSGAVGIRFPNCGISVVGGGRPWGTGSIGVCNMTGSANNRIHEWYKDATALYGLWISDNGGAAAQWMKVTGGQAATTTVIDFNVGGPMNISASSGVLVTALNSTQGIGITDAGGTGAHIRMTSSAMTAPKKYLRVVSNAWEVVNDGYTAVLFSVNESGALTGLGGRPIAWNTRTLSSLTGAVSIGDAGGNYIDQFVVMTANMTVVSGTQGAVCYVTNTSGSNKTLTASGITICLSGNTAAITVITIPTRSMCILTWLNPTFVMGMGVGCTGA
jgi:hypothetical protein